MKLDWSKIDNEKTFQNLVNHLFFLECPSAFGFVPFSPYIGKDGGWDGKYEGFYPREKLTGKFCVQAKYTKHNLNDAMPSLKTWVKDELEKARNNHVDHLRLATCADLREEHIVELEGFNKSHVQSFKIWHGQDLLMRIEREPFLRSYYFSCPAIPLFVPPSIYFENDRNLIGLNDLQDLRIPTIEAKIDEVVQFLRNDKLRIFVIHAPGGYGKSHFLRQFPLKIMENGIDREVWFIRDGIRDIRDAFNDEIGVRDTEQEKRKYVFVLDDADRADDVKDILTCVLKSGVDAKIILSLRTAGLSSLNEMLMVTKCKDLSIEKSIPQWSDDELKSLLRKIAQKDTVKDEFEIVKRYPNPFFIVKIGFNIRGIDNYDFQATRQAIIQSLFNDANQILASSQVDVKELLLHLALITPINIFDSHTISKLANKVNVDEARIKKFLEKLAAGGVLRSIGSIFRFIPDMIGDIYLFDSMESLSEDSRRQVFLYWLDTHSKNIFCNLGATLRYGEKDFLVPIVTDVVSGWISNIQKYDAYEKRRVLENLEDVCFFIPDKSLDMLWAFIKDPDLNTDAFGPVIVRLIHSDCQRQKIVDMIEGLRNRVKVGTYDNYKPNTLVKEAVSPLRNSIENKIMPILEIIEASFRNNMPLDEFAKTAFNEILASSHEYSHSTYSGMEFGGRALRATDAVIGMRNKAVRILKMMLLDSRVSARLNGIEVIEEIGRSHFGGPGGPIPLDGKITEERDEMLSYIVNNKLIDKENDWRVLSSYEDLLFGWWAQQIISDEKISPLISKFNLGSEYRIFRYYSSRWDVGGGIQDKMKEAPSEGRWKWAVENLMRKWDLTEKDFEQDAQSLSKKYTRAQDIVGYLETLNQMVTLSARATFLRAWFEICPDIFKSIRFDAALWSRVPLVFKYTISFDLVRKYPETAKIILNEILLNDQLSLEDSKIAVEILSCDLPSLDKAKFIKLISGKNIDALNLTIIEKLRFIGDKFSAVEMAEIVLVVFKHLSPSARSKSTDHISFILHGKDADYIHSFISLTKDVLCSTIVETGKLDYHDFEISCLIFNNVKTMANFIGARLEKEELINKYSEYEAIPHDGIRFLEKSIHGEADYLFLLGKVLEWDKKYSGMGNFSVTKVFEQLVSLKNEATKLYLDVVKATFYNTKHFVELLNCLYRLPLIGPNLEVFNDVLQKSMELGFEKEVAELLKRKIYPEGGWSSSVGQVPPAFIEKKEVFLKLREKVQPGIIRDALDLCVQGVEKMIDEHNKDEENRFHSR